MERNQYPWRDIYNLSVAAMLPIREGVALLGPFALKEYRTIHMGFGRQSGKTRWMLEELVDNPQHLFIQRDKYLRDDSIEQYDKLPGSPKNGRNRIFTFMDLLHMDENVLKMLLPGKRTIFIDEARNQSRLRDIYELLAKHCTPNQVVIVAMGV